MEYILIIAICFGASLIGSICGIGGGVIIKPMMDATSTYGVSAISFLSGCTVLSMTAFSIAREVGRKRLKEGSNISLILAPGAAIGGILGKIIFTAMRAGAENDFGIGVIQSVVLFVITAGTFVYTLLKERVRKRNITNTAWISAIGGVLGMVSAFLGIGGGPINILVLSYCFSMKTKDAARCSLFIIFLSQLTSLFTTLITCTVPSVNPMLLLSMVVMGVAGGAAGRRINDMINQRAVDVLFISLLLVIMGITLYNCGHNASLLTAMTRPHGSVN